MSKVASKRCLVVTLAAVAAAAGCQHSAPGPRTPYVASRFSAAGAHAAAVQTLGLSIQSEDERIALSGAERLSVILPRELELSPAGVRVQTIPGPLVLTPAPAGHNSPAAIHTVSYQQEVPEPPVPGLPPLSGTQALPGTATQPGTEILPAVPPIPAVPPVPFEFQSDNDPQLPPSVFCPPQHSVPLNVDHVLEVKILDYRPWAPMSISLQLTARDGATLTPVAVTTATWITRGDEVIGNCLKLTERKKRKQFHKEVTGKPSEGHNSPDAFLQIVSEEVATWYSIALMPPVPEGMDGQVCPPMTQ